MKYALIDSDNKVVNIIDYDPTEPYGPYTPPDGQFLVTANDWVCIGDDINAPDPSSLQEN